MCGSRIQFIISMAIYRRFTVALRLLVLALCILACTGTRLEAEQLLSQVPLIDGHNDFPWSLRRILANQINDFNFSSDLTKLEPWASTSSSHTDLPRLKRGKMGAQFWAAYVSCSAQNVDPVVQTLEQIDVIKRLVDMNPESLALAKSSADILDTFNSDHRRVASLIGVEGGHSIGNSLGVLRMYYELGVRYLSLTHNCNTPWADSATDTEVLYGLSDFGEKVVREMNRLGMLVDLSHVSANTSRAVIKLSRAPVIFSHSSVYSLCPHNRNVPDDIIQSVKDTGGVIMVNFYSNFVTCSNTATLADVVEHLTYIKNLVGSRHVGVGADYNGVDRTPEGLEDTGKYPDLFSVLIESGQWTREDLSNLAGQNLLRVFTAVEKVRDELKDENVRPEEHPETGR